MPKKTNLGTKYRFDILDKRGKDGFPDGPEGLIYRLDVEKALHEYPVGGTKDWKATFVIRTDTSGRGWRIDKMDLFIAESVRGLKDYYRTPKDAAKKLAAYLDTLTEYDLGSESARPARRAATQEGLVMPNLRQATIKLAHSNPELRKHLVPILQRTAAKDGWSEVTVDGKKYRWRKNDLFKKNSETAAALDIEYIPREDIGWKPVKNLGTRSKVFEKALGYKPGSGGGKYK